MNGLPVTPETLTTLYEDKYIKVLSQAGDSDFLVVTFGDLVTLANGDRYSADVPIKKLRINCLGFMAKQGNWYPFESMIRARDAIAETTSKYRNIVTYGGSMGGYAAIKYSRILGSTVSIAFCPQWSIDKNECNGTNPGYQRYYAPHMQGMGITKDDIGGTIIVAYDPDHHRDAFHAKRIEALSSSVVPVRARSTDHHVTLVLAGTQHLGQMIRLALEKDTHELKVLINNIRRSHPRRTKILLNKLSQRHPRLFEGVISNASVFSKIDSQDLSEMLSKSLAACLANNSYATALGMISRLENLGICRTRKNGLAKVREELKGIIAKSYFKELMTSHKTVIEYDVVSGKLVHSKASCMRSDRLAACISSLRGREYLALLDNDTLVYPIVRKDGLTSIVDELTALVCTSNLLVIARTEHNFTIKIGDRFLSAESDGGISFNREEVKAWELFIEKA